jgi:multiple sugar transport system substrate-binding protein
MAIWFHLDRQSSTIPRRNTLGRVVLASLAVAVIVALVTGSGCGNSTSGSSQTGNGKVVINFWNGFTGPDGVTMTAIVNQFQKQNPDVVVKMQIIPWTTYYDKLTLALAYGGAPEVFIMQASRFPEYASYNTLRPLSDLNQSSPAPLSGRDFAAAPWKESHYGGQLLALPMDTWPIGLYYNTKLFKEAGIVDAQGNALPPKTYAEFLADAQKLTKDTTGDGKTDQWGFAITNEHSNWLTFADQFGGGILTKDGKQGAMSSPQSLLATQTMCDLIYKYKVAPVPDGFNSWLEFQQGKVAMVMEGIYMLSSLEEQQNLDFSGAPAPQFGPVTAVWGGSHLLCEPSGIDPVHARAGWRLIRFLSDHNLRWAQGGQVPDRLTVLHSAAFKALPVQSAFGSQLPHVIYDPQVPKANSLNQFVDPAIEAALLQLQSPQDAMRDADRRIDQLLNRP